VNGVVDAIDDDGEVTCRVQEKMCLLVMSIAADELSTPAWQRAIVVSIYIPDDRSLVNRRYSITFVIFR